MTPLPRRCGWHPVPLPGWDFTVNYSPAALLPHPESSSPRQMMLSFLSWFPSEWAGHSKPGETIHEVSLFYSYQYLVAREAELPGRHTPRSLLWRQGEWRGACFNASMPCSPHLGGRLSIDHPGSLRKSSEKWMAWHVAGVWGMHRTAGSCKSHIESLLDNYIFHLPTIWSGDLLFFICTIYIFLAIHNILCIFKRSEQAWERDGVWGRHESFNPEWTIFYTSICFPCPVLNTAVRTRGSLKRLFWLMQCSCIKLEIHPKILEGGRQRWLRAMKGTVSQDVKRTCARS